jgi:hypothetical protein
MSSRILQQLVAVSRDVGGVNYRTLSFKCTFPPGLDENRLEYLIKDRISSICRKLLYDSPERCLTDVRHVGQQASDQVLAEISTQQDLEQTYQTLQQAEREHRANSCMICGRLLPGGGACSTCLCDMSKLPPGTEHVRPP